MFNLQQTLFSLTAFLHVHELCKSRIKERRSGLGSVTPASWLLLDSSWICDNPEQEAEHVKSFKTKALRADWLLRQQHIVLGSQKFSAAFELYLIY